MWATLPAIPSPPNTISTTQLPPRRQVSAAVRNRQGREAGVLGMAAAAALGHNNERQMKKSVPPPFTQERVREESEDRRRERQLSGADVLVALQKANAKKSMKQKGQKDVSRRVPSNSKRGNQGITSLSSVKPLCVKPEWSERLQDLETRLEDLIHG